MQNRVSLYKITLLFLCLVNMGGVASLILPYNIIDILIILFSVIIINKCHSPFNNGPLLKWVLLGFLFFVFSALFTETPLINYKGFFLRLFSAYLVVCAFNCDSEEIRHYFVISLKIVAYLALINVFLYTLVPGLFYAVRSDSGYSINSIGLIFNYGTSAQLFGIFYRNQGIFWEPGVLQMSVSLLIFNEIIIEKKNLVNVIIPILSLITTASTTGLFLLAIIIAYRMFFVREGSAKGIKQYIAILLFLPFFLPILRDNASNKFEGEGSISTAYRLNDMLLGFEIAGDYPIMGIGFNQEKYFKISNNTNLASYQDIEIGLNRGNSNTLSEVMIFLGIPAFLVFIVALYKQTIFPQKNFFFIIFIISIISEPLLVTTMMMVFLLSSLLKRKKVIIAV